LRDLVIFEEVPLRVGHDELVLAFTVANRIRRLAFVFDEADDLELDLAPVRRLDEERFPQLERTPVALRAVRRTVTTGFDRGPPLRQ
jgi:hypothetical protein